MPRLRHLAIVTSNRERMVKFYTVAFGMRVIYARPVRPTFRMASSILPLGTIAEI